MHPFEQRLLEDNRATVVRIGEEMAARGEVRAKTPPKLTAVESYQTRVLAYVLAAYGLLEDINVVRVVIASDPTSTLLKRLRLTRSAYVNHQYRQHVLMMVSAHDVALNLCNAALALQIPHHQISEREVVRKVRSKPVLVKTIKAVCAVARRYKGDRNDHLHHGRRLEAAELDHVGLIERVQQLSHDAKMEPLNFPAAALDLSFIASSTEVISRLYEEREHLLTALHALYDELLPLYEAHVPRLAAAAEKLAALLAAGQVPTLVPSVAGKREPTRARRR